MAKANLKEFDELFKSSEAQNNTTSNAYLPLSKLQPFSKHPFKKHNTEKMQELAESITKRGIIVPILVRPIENDKYEIISGHNRVEASRLAGIEKIPCDIREMDDNTATITMVDSNLQRETVLPSEKAWAYKYKLEAIKSQGKRNDLTSAQVAPKLSTSLLGEKFQESSDTVKRFIRLTRLETQLLEKVDDKKLAFIPAVELSYLKKQEQKCLFSILEREEYFGVPLALARKLKGISQNGNLTEQKIDDIILAKVKSPPRQIKVSRKILNKYFSDGITPQERDTVIDKALEEWFKQNPRKIEHNKIEELSL